MVWATPFRITGALVDAGEHLTVSVSFSDPITRDGPQTDLSMVTVDGAPGVRVTVVTPPDVDPVTSLALTLSGPLPPGEIKVCFRRINYVRDEVTTTTTAEICAAVSADIKTAIDAAMKVVTDTPRAPDEMTANASGFVTTGDNDTEGGADLAFNPKLSDPNATAFFRLKKATSDDGDARHFEVGAAYRVGIPWKPAALRAIRDAPDLAVMNQRVMDRQRRLIAGTVVNLAMKLEGEPTGFDATNGVGEADYQIHSMTKRLFGRQGFWRGYLIPAGVEIGRKLGVERHPHPRRRFRSQRHLALSRRRGAQFQQRHQGDRPHDRRCARLPGNGGQGIFCRHRVRPLRRQSVVQPGSAAAGFRRGQECSIRLRGGIRMTANEDLLSTTAAVPVESNAAQRGREAITAFISLVILVAAMTAFGLTFLAARETFAETDLAKKQAYERQKDLLMIATGLLGTVTGYYLGRVPAELRAATAQTAVDRAQAEVASTTGLLNGAQQEVADQARTTEDVKKQAREAANAALKALNEQAVSTARSLRGVEDPAASTADALAQDARVRLERRLLL